MSASTLWAQQIQGIVLDRSSNKALANVQFKNIFQNLIVYSDSLGHFSIAASKGELIEVRKAGFRQSSFRISMGKIAPYFKIILDEIIVFDTNRYAHSTLNAYQIDSIKSRNMFSEALNFPKLSFGEQLESPFSALSKHNQMIWKFQDHYNLFEREKFIDFNFNATIVEKNTGLKGDDLQLYMRLNRPSYEMLRQMSQYDFYQYIRKSALRFQQHQNNQPRNSN